MAKFSAKIQSVFLSLDLFSESIQFSINGKRAHRSILGSIFSLGIFATVLAFGINKFKVSLSYQDTLFQQTIEKNYYEENVEYKFDGFGLAYSVVNLNTNQPIVDYQRFMKIRIDEAISTGDHSKPLRKPISTHKCS